MPFSFPWLEVLLICPGLTSQAKWVVCFNNVIRVNYRLLLRHVSVIPGLELKKKKKSILTSPLLLIAHAKRTGFAISKNFILTSFLQDLKNVMAILCQKSHLSFFVAIVS